MLRIGDREIPTDIRISPRGFDIERQLDLFEAARALSPEDKLPELFAAWFVGYIYSLPVSVAEKNQILADSSFGDMQGLYAELRRQLEILNLTSTMIHRRRVAALLVIEHIDGESITPEMAFAIEEMLIANGKRSHHAIEAFLAASRTVEMTPEQEAAGVCAMFGQEVPEHLKAK